MKVYEVYAAFGEYPVVSLLHQLRQLFQLHSNN